MDLASQTALAEHIAVLLGQPGERIRDLRESPHSGYRAVHIWCQVPAGRFEVQVRTLLQGAWANAYEALGDVAGRSIRYTALPDQAAGVWANDVARMMELSTAIATLEQSGSVPVHQLNKLNAALADVRKMELRFRRAGRR